MQFNPYKDELDQLNAELRHATSEHERFRRDCERYDAFDVEHVNLQRQAVADAIPGRTVQADLSTARLETINSSIADLKKRSALGFNPRFWFSSERGKLLQQLQNAQVMMTSAAGAARQSKISLQAALDKLKRIDEATSWYRAFDRTAASGRLGQLTLQMHELHGRLPAVQLATANLDVKLAPILADLAAAQARMEDANQLIAEAERFDSRLTNAANSYERKTIHEQCNAKLGNDGPAKLITQGRRAADAAARDIEKLKRSATQLASRTSRCVERIVFDGNNLCYGRSNEFIGIAPLQAIVRALTTNASKIIVFDASIRNHGFNEKSLTGAIGKNVSIHIVNGAADETILDLASEEHHYVVSNDKFMDYRTKPAVAGGRIFRHEHVNNQIMIHELELSTTYA